jgi:hypothetical protein
MAARKPIHYLNPEESWTTPCNVWHPVRWTIDKNGVTCNHCLKALGKEGVKKDAKPKNDEMELINQKISTLEKENENLKKSIRIILDTCLAILHTQENK